MCTLLMQNICFMCHTQGLGLGGNQIGDAGLTALAKAVESGALASLDLLDLQHNAIGDAGMQALAGAVSNGALPKCTSLHMGGNPASKEATQTVKDAIASRK